MLTIEILVLGHKEINVSKPINKRRVLWLLRLVAYLNSQPLTLLYQSLVVIVYIKTPAVVKKNRGSHQLTPGSTLGAAQCSLTSYIENAVRSPNDSPDWTLDHSWHGKSHIEKPFRH